MSGLRVQLKRPPPWEGALGILQGAPCVLEWPLDAPNFCKSLDFHESCRTSVIFRSSRRSALEVAVAGRSLRKRRAVSQKGGTQLQRGTLTYLQGGKGVKSSRRASNCVRRARLARRWTIGKTSVLVTGSLSLSFYLSLGYRDEVHRPCTLLYESLSGTTIARRSIPAKVTRKP